MQILMLCALDVWSLGSQSGAPSLFKTLEAYSAAGHTIHFITSSTGANTSRSLNSLRSAAANRIAEPSFGLRGVQVHTVPVMSLGDTGLRLGQRLSWVNQKLRFATLYPVLAARAGMEILRKQRIDLIYGYEVHGVLAARLLRPFTRAPLVTRFQGTVVFPCLNSPLQFVRKIEEVVALKSPADLTIMTDDGTQGDMAVTRLRGRLPASFRFWRNGLDLERLHPASPHERSEARSLLNLGPSRTVVLTSSRLARWKRVDRAIRAMESARKAAPDILLLIVGDGEERQSLERLTHDLGLRDCVRFEGAVSQGSIQRYYHASDIFLSTNELSNVGNPLLEALACGKPVVTLANGSTSRLVESSVNGVLLNESSTPECIGKEIACLAVDEERRNRLGDGARALAVRDFRSWEARMNAELSDVESLLGHHE